MKSIKELYKIGKGPSSSHTMGPQSAAQEFLKRVPESAVRFEVTLYGSLAATGKGHMTDEAIINVFKEHGHGIEIVWRPETFLPYHPNAMTFKAYDREGKQVSELTIYSVGGGAIKIEGDPESAESPEIYGINKMSEIVDYCQRTGKCYWEYVEECEGSGIWPYLSDVWAVMRRTDLHRRDACQAR